MESKLLSLGKIGYFFVHPDKLLLKQEIGMSPVSLGFCRKEVSKRERENLSTGFLLWGEGLSQRSLS